MDSVSDLLNRYQSSEPAEISLIKKFIAEQFKAGCTVSIQGETLIITVASASLAGTLRMRIVQLQEACQTTKRLVFRIG